MYLYRQQCSIQWHTYSTVCVALINSNTVWSPIYLNIWVWQQRDSFGHNLIRKRLQLILAWKFMLIWPDSSVNTNCIHKLFHWAAKNNTSHIFKFIFKELIDLFLFLTLLQRGRSGSKILFLWSDPFPHSKENHIYVFLFWQLRGLIPNFHIHVSVSDLLISRIGPHIFLQQNRQTDPGNI